MNTDIFAVNVCMYVWMDGCTIYIIIDNYNYRNAYAHMYVHANRNKKSIYMYMVYVGIDGSIG